MTYKLLILFSIFLLSKELQAQAYIQDTQTIEGLYNLLDEYFEDCHNDSTEIRQIGVIEQVVTREFAGFSGSKAVYNAKIETDTTWYNEDNHLGYSTLETIYRKVWIHKEPTLTDFKNWLKRKYY